MKKEKLKDEYTIETIISGFLPSPFIGKLWNSLDLAEELLLQREFIMSLIRILQMFQTPVLI